VAVSETGQFFRLSRPVEIISVRNPSSVARRSGINGALVNPNGIPSLSPGLRGTRYPGSTVKNIFNPNGVASMFPKSDATLSGLLKHLIGIPTMTPTRFKR